MENPLFDKLAEKYPFLTICRHAENEYVGIIQNKDNAITSMYDFGMLETQELKIRFLELGEMWWWESNRLIPINIFLRGEWDVFHPYTRTFNNKTLEILAGPVTSLSNLAQTKRKRKSITLVKRVD